MTRVISLRLPTILERTIRAHAANSNNMGVANLVRLILQWAVDSDLRLGQFPDAPQSLECKLDVRLPAELVERIRAESARFHISVSVYSRIILHGYYGKRLIAVKIGGRYTLAENHEQKKSA